MSARQKHRTETDTPDRRMSLSGRIGSSVKLPDVIARKGPPDPEKLTRAREIARAAYERATDEEDAEISAAARSDPDSPLLEDVLERSEMRRLGRPPSSSPKRSVNLRLDRDVVEAFVAGGPGWQTRMNAALRKAAGLE